MPYEYNETIMPDGSVIVEEVFIPDELQDAINKQNRLVAYRDEADPLFFKWQRGEATKEEWLNKITEIQTKYPKP